jgi:hypothetical protein
MHPCPRFVLALCMVTLNMASLASVTIGAELLAPETDIVTVIDRYVDSHLENLSVSPEPAVSDSHWLRRVTLDLAGRIPTAPEYAWFQQQAAPERRALLVDRLMSMPDFDFHLRNCLDELLLPNRPYNGEFREYLLWATKQRRPWDKIFQDMLVARDIDGDRKGANQFLLSRVGAIDDLTNDTAILFFGVNISCAKCHDHPLVDDWRQEHYYGLQSFFSRTFATRGNLLTERPFGELKFSTTEGEEKVASLMFLTGTQIEDKSPKFEEGERKQLEEQMRKLEQVDNAGYVIYPTFSPRAALVDAAIKDTEQRLLAKNIVNRTWNRLLGTGLVDPPDQMHSGNPPSHPELLEWLARDLVSHSYDLRRLIRGIVLSNSYARSSQWTGDGLPPAKSTFAVLETKPLTPRQLSASLLVAVRKSDHWVADPTNAQWTQQRQELESHAEGWSREFELPGENFQIAVDEALFFSNSARVLDDLLRDGGDRLVNQLKTMDDEPQVLRTLWINILSREPSDDELATASGWLAREGHDRFQSLRDLAWALLAGSEFRFNH